MSLTLSEEKFCQEFVKLRDGKAAAVAAGYDPAVAGKIGQEKLRKSRIRKRINEIINNHTHHKAGITATEIETGDNKKERSPSAHFFVKPWIIALAIILAVAGGSVAIIDFWKNLDSGAKLTFNVVDVVSGDAGKDYAVLLIGTLYNDGDKPLMPQNFGLEVMIKERFIKAQKSFLPKQLYFKADSLTVAMDAAKRYDLQRVTRLDPSVPVQGELIFYIPKSLASDDELMKGKFVLTTQDLSSNKRYECTLDLPDIAKKSSRLQTDSLR